MDPTHPGFAHGFGLFETIKLSGGRLCFWAEHWKRLAASAAALGMALDCEAGAALSAIRTLCREGGTRDGTIKLSLLRAGGREACLYIYARPALVPLPVTDRVSLKFDSRCPINAQSPLAGHKTHNYMENLWLLERARAAGDYDVLRVDTRGMLAETAMGNIFFIQDGRLRTPARATGILPGVVRQCIMELAAVEEGLYGPEVLAQSEAVFLTNSSVGLLPINSVEGSGQRFAGESGRHPMVRDLQKVFADLEESRSVAL